MAVTVDSSPADVVAVGNCIRYALSLSDGGTPPQVKSTGYQLYEDGGGAITQEIEQIPYTGASEAVEFQDVLRKQVQTTPQQPGAQVDNVKDTTFAIDFYLKYGEIIFDSSDCSTNLSGVSSNDAVKTAANIAFQWHQDQSALPTGVTPCTNRPLKNYVCRTQSDWLWLYKFAAGSYAIIVTVYYTDGTNSAKSYEVTPGASIFSIGPGNFFDGDFSIGKTWQYYTIEVYSDLAVTLLKTYTFYVVDCCAGLSPSQLFWLEPMGGYAGIQFDEVQKGNTLSSNVYDQAVDCSLSSVSDLGKSGGKSKSRSISVRQVLMRKTMPYEEGIDLFLEGLVSSRNHYVNYPGPSGDVLAKFVLADGNYTVANDGKSLELTVSGELHIDFNVL